MRIVAGMATILIGFWAFPYVKTGVIDPFVSLLTGLFPGMNSYLVLFLTWAPIVVIGIIVYAVISLVLNLGGRHG